MFVITADQDASSRTGDKVEQILRRMARAIPAQDVVLPFQRTVGDEIQAVFDSAPVVLASALELTRAQDWAVGIGIGAVDLAEEARSSSGAAFVCARTAVERASSKAVTVPLAVVADGVDEGAADEAEALVQLLAAVVRRRSDAGWEVADLLRDGAGSQRAVATELGITPQAVGQRLRVALWSEEQAVHPLAARLLAGLDRSADAHGEGR
ncbi:hypothetical protein ACO0LV_00890 [Pseudactinotalea sp. Z1739]|uniref:hypothetical protein n=1 Tax=Pseudactinotalea sp. Z1739 TaxID=3413028 RepID=UPI003C7B91FA